MTAQGQMNMADTPACVTADRSASLLGRQVSLVEVLDRVLNKGAVVVGGITVSVADIPLLYVGLNLIIASVETLKKQRTKTFSVPFGDG